MWGVKIKIEQVEYHRNGVGGEGFYAITFEDEENGRMVATVFPEYQFGPDGEELPVKGCGRTAVYSIPGLVESGVEFGVNSWRGDVYETALIDAINDRIGLQRAEWARA